MSHTIRHIAASVLASIYLAAASPGAAQEFSIAWSTVGEAFSKGDDAAPVQQGSRVVRVEVEPAVIEIAVGKQWCIGMLEVQAFAPDGGALAGAPLTITVREDQKLQLQLTRPKGDICMRPAKPGEYPIRFTSKLPAPDSTQRGAQVFLRAS